MALINKPRSKLERDDTLESLETDSDNLEELEPEKVIHLQRQITLIETAPTCFDRQETIKETSRSYDPLDVAKESPAVFSKPLGNTNDNFKEQNQHEVDNVNNATHSEFTKQNTLVNGLEHNDDYDNDNIVIDGNVNQILSHEEIEDIDNNNTADLQVNEECQVKEDIKEKNENIQLNESVDSEFNHQNPALVSELCSEDLVIVDDSDVNSNNVAATCDEAPEAPEDEPAQVVDTQDDISISDSAVIQDNENSINLAHDDDQKSIELHGDNQISIALHGDDKISIALLGDDQKSNELHGEDQKSNELHGEDQKSNELHGDDQISIEPHGKDQTSSLFLFNDGDNENVNANDKLAIQAENAHDNPKLNSDQPTEPEPKVAIDETQVAHSESVPSTSALPTLVNDVGKTPLAPRKLRVLNYQDELIYKHDDKDDHDAEADSDADSDFSVSNLSWFKQYR